MKICNKCGTQNPDTSTFCAKCGNTLTAQQPFVQPPAQTQQPTRPVQPVQPQQFTPAQSQQPQFTAASTFQSNQIVQKPKKPIFKKWWFWVIIAVVVIIIIAAIGGSGSDNNSTSANGTTANTTSANNSSADDSQSDSNEVTNTTAVPESDDLSFGDTFTFDDLEITIGSDYKFVKLDNQFADHSGADVIELPITVKNLKSESGTLNLFYHKAFGTAGTELDNVTAYFEKDDIDFAGDMRSGATKESNMHFLYDGDGEYVLEFDNFSEKIEVKLQISK